MHRKLALFGTLVCVLYLCLGISYIHAQEIYYSYTASSGDWHNPTTWTTDPTGLSLLPAGTGMGVPEAGASVVIKAGNPVFLSANVSELNLDLTIETGATLDLRDKLFTDGIHALHGAGRLLIASDKFPNIAANKEFLENNGGSVIFKRDEAVPVNIKNFPTEVWNLEFAGKGHYAYQVRRGRELKVLKNLSIKDEAQLFFGGIPDQPENGANFTRKKLAIHGNLAVEANASLSVINGTLEQATPTSDPISYYESSTHILELYGELTNSGRVTLHNLPNLDFGRTTLTTHNATLIAAGTTNSTFYCNGKTDLYALVLDKGTNADKILTINAVVRENFRLWGANSQDGKRALFLKNGTLNLTGKTAIASLAEKGTYIIESSSALVLDGAEVLVVQKAQNAKQVADIWGLTEAQVLGVNKSMNEADAASLEIANLLYVKNGSYVVGDGAVIETGNMSPGELRIENGKLFAPQIRSGLMTFIFKQTGGLVVLRGKREDKDVESYASTVNPTRTYGATYNATPNYREGRGAIDLKSGDSYFHSAGEFRVVGGTEHGTTNYLISLGIEKTAQAPVRGGKVVIDLTGLTLTTKPNAPEGYATIMSNASFGDCDISLNTDGQILYIKSNITIDGNLHHKKGVLALADFENHELQLTVGKNFQLDATLDARHGKLAFSIVDQCTFTIPATAKVVDNNFHYLAVTTATGKPQKLLHFDAPVDYTFGDLRATGNSGFRIVNRDKHLIVKKQLDIGGSTDIKGGQVILDGSSVWAGSWGYVEDCLLTENTRVKLRNVLRIDKLLTLSQGSELDIGAYSFWLSAGAKVVTPGNGTGHIKTNGKATDDGVRKAFNADDEAGFDIPFGYWKGTTFVDRRLTIKGRKKEAFYFRYVEGLHPMLRNGYPFYLRVVEYEKNKGKVVDDGATITMKNTEATLPANYKALFFKIKENQWEEQTTPLPTPAELCFNLHKTADGFDYAIGEKYELTSFVSVKDGNWNDPTTWNPARVPLAGDLVTVKHKVHVAPNLPDYTTEAIACGGVTITSGGVLDIPDMSLATISQILGEGKLRLRLHPDAPQRDKFQSMPAIESFIFKTVSRVEVYGTIEFYMEQQNKEAQLPEQIPNYGILICSYEKPDQTFVLSSHIERLVVQGNLYLNNPDAHPNAIFSIGGVQSPLSGTWKLNVGNETVFHNVDFCISKPARDVHLMWLGDVHFRGVSQVRHIGVVPPHWSCFADINLYKDLTNDTGGELHFADNNRYSRFYVSTYNKISRIKGIHPISFREFHVRMSGATSQLFIENTGGIRSAADPSLEWFYIDKEGTVHVNSAFDFQITTKQQFRIRAGAIFHVNNDNLNVRIATDCTAKSGLLLQGALKIEKGKVFVGRHDLPSNQSADLEYGANYTSRIEILDGELNVYGALRRTQGVSSGILTYIQTAGKVTVAPTPKNAGKRGLEIYGDEHFSIAGGELIFSGAGGSLVKGGDLFILSPNSSVTGGTIRLTGSGNVYLASMPNFYNLTCEGNNQEVHVYQYPLDVKGITTIGATSKLFADDVDISFAGNMLCDGAFNAKNNTTRFYEAAKRIYGNASAFTAHKLVIESSDGLSYELPIDASVSGDLAIAKKNAPAEHLDLKNRTWILEGDLDNQGGYKTSGGGLQLVGSKRAELKGNGNYGSIEVKKSAGALAANDVNLFGNLLLTNGSFYLDKYLLHIAQEGKIEQHSTNHYIVTNGSFIAKGIQQDLKTNVTLVNFPLGTETAYTPVELSIDGAGYQGSSGSVRVLNIANYYGVNDRDCQTKVLKYHWEVESHAGAVTGQFKFSCPTSFKGGNMTLEESAPLRYYNRSWSLQTKHQLSESGSTFTQLWKFNNAASLSGRYTGGVPLCLLKIREVETAGSGNWDSDIWKPYGNPTADNIYLPDGPNGMEVHIKPEHTVTISHKANAKKIVFERPAPLQQEGVLDIKNEAIIPSLGSVHGQGALRVYKGDLPAADYTEFFGCAYQGKLILAGNADYALAPLGNNEYPYLYLKGTHKRSMPNANLTVCKELRIDDQTTYDNSVYNKGLLLLGKMSREATASFVAGTGDGAWVWFKGTTPQEIGGANVDFQGVNKLNKLIIENDKGVTVRSGGVVEITDLRLKKGILHTPRNTTGRLFQTPAVTNASSSDAELVGNAASYVDGPLWVKIPAAGITAYRFPLGIGTALANQMILRDLTPGEICVEVLTNPSTTNVQAPLTLVDAKLWKVFSKKDEPTVSAKVGFLREGFALAVGKEDAELSVAKKGSEKWEEVPSSPIDEGALGKEIRSNATETLKIDPGYTWYTLGAQSTVLPTLSYVNPAGLYCTPVTGSVKVPIKIVASGEWNDYRPMLVRYKVGANERTYEIRENANEADDFELPIMDSDYPTALTESVELQVLGLTYRHNKPNAGAGQLNVGKITAYRVPDVKPGSYNMCANLGSAVNLLGDSSPKGTPKWINDDGDGTFVNPNAYNTRFTLTRTAVGLVLKLKVDNHGCAAEKNAVLNPVQPSSGKIEGDKLICALNDTPVISQYTFTPTTVSNPCTYAWSLDDDHGLADLKIMDGQENLISPKVSWSATPPNPGEQTYDAILRLKVVDANQCLSTFEKQVKVILDFRTAPVYFVPYNN